MSQGRKRAAFAGAGLLGLVLWLFRGMIPGLGGDASTPADGDGDGVGSTTVVEIIAKGDQCTRAGATKPCAAVCADVAGTVPRVSIDGTEGAHSAVAALEQCLRAKGVKSVSVVNR